MDLNDTPEEAAFRAEVRGWLDKNAPRKSSPNDRWSAPSVEEGLKLARDWQAKKAAARYAVITWPEEYGGRGGSPIQSIIYQQEESNYLVPGGYFEIGLGMCVPTVMAWADKEQTKRFVPPAVRGEEVWCQLFSEPAAGSDLAGIRTRAVRDGDHWIVNGQKVWTSGAHFSDYGVIVTRSDSSLPKHKGLTYFFLDMKSPGVEVRPIRQMSGGSNFNEVFFNDVRIPDSQRLGEVGDGWKVSLTTLMNERLAVGMGGGGNWRDLLDLARATMMEDGPALANDHVRARIADWHTQAQGLKYTRYRTLTALSRGQTPGPENSIIKVVSAVMMQNLGAFATEIEDMGGILSHSDQAPGGGQFQDQWIGAAGFRIAGGTDEILRNIIAERVLGLPPDIRVDKTRPFAELPKGK